MLKWRSEATLDVYNLVLGAFLFVSPWLFVFAEGIVAEGAWITGALIALISVAALVAFAEWEEWLNAALGLWIAASPWVLGFPHTAAMRVSVGIGLLITFLSAIELWVIHYDAPPQANVGLR